VAIDETVEHENSSSVAVPDTNQCAWLGNISRSKAHTYLVLPIHPLNGTHTQSMTQLSQGLKNLSPTLYLLIEVDLTDINKGS
jgi:hypothetical protein